MVKQSSTVAGHLARKRDHGAGIQATGKESANRYVGHHLPVHCLAQALGGTGNRPDFVHVLRHLAKDGKLIPLPVPRDVTRSAPTAPYLAAACGTALQQRALARTPEKGKVSIQGSHI